MLIEILIFLLLGILAGTFTGLMPGIHINLIGTAIASGAISISFNMIILERRKFAALSAFLLAGLLGFIVLNMTLKEPLLPLLTGLFGSASLFFSIKQNTKIGKQELLSLPEKIEKKRTLLSSAVFAPLSLFL